MAEQYDIRFQLMADASTTAALQAGDGVAGLPIGSAREDARMKQIQMQQSAKSLTALIGIQFSIAALLKNSQVFTSSIGALFQLLGAFIDITLGPLMPLFANVLSYLGSKFPAYIGFVQTLTPQIVQGVKNIGNFARGIYDKVISIGAPVFSLFDKDGVSADGRLRLSDIITALGGAVLGEYLFTALRTGSKAVATSTVGALMQGTVGRLTKFIRGVGFISLIFSGLSIANIFEESGLKAGILALADFTLTTVFSAIGAVMGSFGGPLGILIGGALGGLGYQKFLSPSIFGNEGGLRSQGAFTASDSGPSSTPNRAVDYQQALAYPVSDTASFVAGSNTNLYDYDRAVGRQMAGR